MLKLLYFKIHHLGNLTKMKKRGKKENCNLAWHHFITSRFAISTFVVSRLLFEDNLMKSVSSQQSRGAAWLLARLASDEQKSNLPKATLLTSLLPWDINESSKLYILYFVISAASKSSSHDVLCLLISRFLVSSH